MQIGRKIYFDKATGNPILDTGERDGDVVGTTVEQDFSTYSALAERISSTVDYIQLEYGQYVEDFSQCNGYRIDPDTKEILFSYPDPNQPEQPPVFQKPLTDQIKELEAKLNPPTPDEIFLSLEQSGVENVDIESLMEKKKDQLNYLCNQEILAGFKSSALGVEHTYPFSEMDQLNMSGTMALLNGDSTITELNWKTIDTGPLLHSRDAYFQVCKDSFIFKQSKISKYWSLKAQVEAATDKTSILQINW